MSELEEKIKKELLKSGFPLQIFCRRCLLQNDWEILGAPEYFISDPDIKGEIDALGIYTDELDDKMYIDYEIFIECKKNQNNPWVFFKGKNATIDIPIFYTRATPKEWPHYLPPIKGLHFEKVPASSIHTTAFQEKKKTNQIYEAISSVSLAYRFRRDFLERHKQAREEKEWVRGATEDIVLTTIISFLTILLDGKLYLADVGKDDTIDLVETSNIVYSQTEVQFPRVQIYSIDIVTKDYFPNYLRMLNKDRELISEFYRREISAATA